MPTIIQRKANHYSSLLIKKQANKQEKKREYLWLKPHFFSNRIKRRDTS